MKDLRHRKNISYKRLIERLSYDPQTGEFRWKVNVPKRKAGQVAGCLFKSRENFYIHINIDRVIYQAHRLAWFYVYGNWPPEDIDHVNGNGLDNRIANLRLSSRSQNHMNRKLCRNAIGFKGVSLHKASGLWRARIKIGGKGGKQISLGYWKTPQQAKEAYDKAAREYFKEFWRAA